MKHAYLLFWVVAIALNATAQRNVDLSIRHFYKLGTGNPTLADEITNGTHILFDGDEQFKFNLAYIITNSATLAKDSVMTSDTIKFKTTFNGGAFLGFSDFDFYIPAGMSYGPFGLSGFPDAVKPGDAFDNTSQALQRRMCDSIWIVSPSGSANPAMEANKANDTTCHNVIIDGWITNVNDIDVDLDGNGLLVYPNPAVSRDINIMYNFGVNTNKAEVTITDVTGRIIYSKIIGTNLRGTQNVPLQIGGIAPGMYSVRLATDEKVSIEKIYVK